MMKKAVLFDMDGILYDSERFYMSNTITVMRALGYTGPEEALYRVIGTTSSGTWKILYDLLDGEYTGKQIEQAWISHLKEHPLNYKKAMFPDIPESLQRLQEHGIRMACCSSSSINVIKDSLERMGITSYFDYVVSSEELERPKPDPMIYLLAAEKLEADPADCIVYEDSTLGIESGKRAGMMVIARRDERFKQDQSRADKFVECATQLTDYILGED